MKYPGTYFLHSTVAIIALAVLALCAVALPWGIASDTSGMYRYILAGLYVPAVPFFAALYQAHRLLRLIDARRAFSLHAVRALRRIQYCAYSISALFAAGLPYMYYVAEQDDAPGLILMGLVIIGAAFVIASFAGLLRRLFEQALVMQSENELTV